MRLATYLYQGRQHVGLAVDDETIHELDANIVSHDLTQTITDWDAVCRRLPAALGARHNLRDIELLAPLPRPPRNIFCVGKNYREHAEEFAASGYESNASLENGPIPDRPVIFTKANSSVIGHGACVNMHAAIIKELDYEAELAVIIGRGGTDIDPADAYDHVWGYTIVNDITARDRQRDYGQWFLGKSLDTFCPMGPYAVTKDEVDLESMIIQCRINGELRQHAPLTDLIFDIPTVIGTISAGLTLQPGDIIATGTPSGVGLGFDPPKFLQPGDSMEVSITGLGTLRNAVA